MVGQVGRRSICKKKEAVAKNYNRLNEFVDVAKDRETFKFRTLMISVMSCYGVPRFTVKAPEIRHLPPVVCIFENILILPEVHLVLGKYISSVACVNNIQLDLLKLLLVDNAGYLPCFRQKSQILYFRQVSTPANQ